MEDRNLPNPHPHTDRFLAAFNRIDRYLRTHARRSRDDSFSAALRAAETDRRVPPNRATDLREYNELRNAIVHGGPSGHALAEVLPEVADDIERIRDLLEDPPVINQWMIADPLICRPEQPIGDVASAMYGRDFSQAPVIDDQAVIGLLTGGTIARWVGALMPGVGLLEDTPVADVLGYQERDDHYRLVASGTPVFTITASFHSAEDAGAPLDALLVTHSGRAHERLLGIITVYDLPRLPQR